MQKGFSAVYIIFGLLILAVVGGGAFYLGKTSDKPGDRQSTKQSSDIQQNPPVSQNDQKITTSPATQPSVPSPTPQILTGETIQIKVRTPPYSVEIKDYTYKFSFNKKIGDIVKSLPAAYQSGDYSHGIEITRGEVVLTIIPAFDGVSNPYYDQKPEVFELTSTKISSKPIYRIKNQSPETGYTYVSAYSEDCKQWQPRPLACHLSSVYSEKVKGLALYCKANSSTVTECDNFVKSIDVTITEL